jgi:hypothetical protein
MSKDYDTRKPAPAHVPGGAYFTPVTDVDELFDLFNCKMGAQLCNFEFYSRHIPPLQAAYSHEAVAAALDRLYAVIRRRAASDILDLQRNAARLKRESTSAR